MQETPKTTNPYIGKTVVELNELKQQRIYALKCLLLTKHKMQALRIAKEALILLNEAEDIAIKAGNWGMRDLSPEKNWIDKTHEF